MDGLDHSNFGIASCQAAFSTPPDEFAIGPIVNDLLPEWKGLFNGEPSFTPAEGLPPNIPRVQLKSEAADWRCAISPERIDVYWDKTSLDARLGWKEFSARALDMLRAYKGVCRKRIVRLAVLTTRFAAHETPGLFLARHFCKERWDTAPLNRPENFELHAHKQFKLPSGLTVNSWVRSRTGKMSKADDESVVLGILVGQDINTLSEDMPTADFSDADCQRFLEETSPELDTILALYYPAGEET